jgi:hypothetical protein
MMPWEKQIYIALLQKFIEEQNEKMKMVELQKRR